jgi:hypothetical protein
MIKTLPIAAFTFALLATGQALAADCGTVQVGEDGLTAVVPDVATEFDNTSSPFSCDVVADDGTYQVVVPAGTYGVVRVDVSGSQVFLEDTDSYAFQIDANGQVFLVNRQGTGVDLNDYVETAYFTYDPSGSDALFEGLFAVDPNISSAGILAFDDIDIFLRYTTAASIEGSLDQIAAGEAAIVAHTGATASLLTGSDQPLEGENEFGVIGGLGSYMLGLTARYNISEGFSLLGGASLIGQDYADAGVDGVLGAVALRYVEPGVNSFRLFGEGGVTLGAFEASFARHYEDGTDEGVDATGTTAAGLGGAYLRGGVLIEPDADNEIVLSATVQHSMLGLAGYAETGGAFNMFAATLPAQAGSFTVVKGSAAWTTALASDVDLTASASLGLVVGHTPVEAEIEFVGPETGGPASSVFAEGGLRLGWTPSPGTRLDGFIQGSTGTGIGTHAQIGAAYRMSF